MASGYTRGTSRKTSGKSARADCCMWWIVTGFKVILCLMVLLTAISTIIHLVHLFKPEFEQDYISHHGSTAYWILVAVSFFVLFNQILLLVMLAKEQLCGLVITLVIMAAVFGFRIYGITIRMKGDDKDDTANKTSFGFDCLELILLGCYCIILCFAR